MYIGPLNRIQFQYLLTLDCKNICSDGCISVDD